jgi:hypothetical protein
MIPILLGAAALATGAVGALKGAEGIGNMKQAKEIGEQAQQKYESSLQNLKAAWEITNQSAEGLWTNADSCQAEYNCTIHSFY